MLDCVVRERYAADGKDVAGVGMFFGEGRGRVARTALSAGASSGSGFRVFLVTPENFVINH